MKLKKVKYHNKIVKDTNSLIDLVQGQLDSLNQMICGEVDQTLIDKINKTENAINKFENKIDVKIFTYVSLFTPRARDLRTYLALRNIVSDLERIGDHCQSIANKLPDISECCIFEEIYTVAYESNIKALANFIAKEDSYSREILLNKKKVNDLKVKIRSELINSSMSDDCTSKFQNMAEVMLVESILNNISSIAELATNIIEDVIYSIRFRNIRHKHDKFLSETNVD